MTMIEKLYGKGIDIKDKTSWGKGIYKYKYNVT